MDIPSEPYRVFVEPRWWPFVRRVAAARRLGNMVLVLFEPEATPSGRTIRNLVAYGLDRGELWRAEGTGTPDDAYVGFTGGTSHLGVRSRSGRICSLDPSSGRLTSTTLAK